MAKHSHAHPGFKTAESSANEAAIRALMALIDARLDRLEKCEFAAESPPLEVNP